MPSYNLTMLRFQTPSILFLFLKGRLFSERLITNGIPTVKGRKIKPKTKELTPNKITAYFQIVERLLNIIKTG